VFLWGGNTTYFADMGNDRLEGRRRLMVSLLYSDMVYGRGGTVAKMKLYSPRSTFRKGNRRTLMIRESAVWGTLWGWCGIHLMYLKSAGHQGPVVATRNEGAVD